MKHETIKLDPKQVEILKAKQQDRGRYYEDVFKGEAGEYVLNDLKRMSKLNYPNYENVNATYAQAGQQVMVDYIESILKFMKEGGSK